MEARASRGRRPGAVLAAVFVCLSLAGCTETHFATHLAKEISGDTRPQGNYKVGTPYQVADVWYYPAEDDAYDETGIASWYGPQFHGRPTANGERFDMNLVSAAHKTLPMPSMVRITNLENGRALNVRVNDRGPFVHGRVIDVSRQTARLLGFEGAGIAQVRVQILGDESRELARIARGEAPAGEAPVQAAPLASVESEALSPLDETTPPVQTAARTPFANDAIPAPEGRAATPATPRVETVPVQKTGIFVQAGAFSEYANANRLSAVLSPLGPTRISQVVLGEVPMFRVRVGPLASVAEGDAMLEKIIEAGYGNARLIVD